MVIKKVEIAGFKSFANSTSLKFEYKKTSIIGPNGCGKSNVLDAIKWVLGEKSVKAMRGEKMEDIIFSGTEGKKPSNFAQVAIHIDNSRKLFHLDHPEVKIARRLYRDGQSQYLINDTRVTRKEIETLLMDTGLGKSSYSFMEQGQMDMILSSKPEDRRLLFEEAAGISRFKSQRSDAEKNLERANLNITRLRDIMHGMEKDLQTKTIQAEKTLRYNELLSAQKEHDLKIRYGQFKDQESAIDKLGERINSRKKDLEKLDQKILVEQEGLRKIEKEMEILTGELHEKDAANRVNREKISQWEGMIANHTARKGQIEREKAILGEKVETSRERLNTQKNKMSSMAQHRITVNGNASSIEKDMEGILVEIENNRTRQEQIGLDIKNLKNEIINGKNDLKDVRAEQETVIRDLLDSLKKEKSSYDSFESEKNLRKVKIFEKIDQISGSLARSLDYLQNQNISPAVDELKKLITSMEKEDLKTQIDKVTSISEGLYHILFEKGGVHSRKEEMDEMISRLDKTIHHNEEELEKKRRELEDSQTNQHDLNSAYQQLKAHRKQIQMETENLEKEIQTLEEIIQNETQTLKYFETQFGQKEEEEITIYRESQKMIKDISDIKDSIAQDLGKIQSIEEKIRKTTDRKNELQEKLEIQTDNRNKIQLDISEQEFQMGAFLGNKESIIQDIYNSYTMTMEELEQKFKDVRIQIKKEKDNFFRLQKEIENLGPVNPLAISEKNRIEELYKHNQEQLDDILKSQDNILNVIHDIEKKSQDQFLESFEQIKINFRSTFRQLFQGGEAELFLQEPEKPLESGIEISVQPPGKRPKSIRLLSGGEKALTAIALMFAVYMVRSSPLCVLDEIDAPLDDQNVGRFLDLLHTFAENTQFILITHNKKTISRTDMVFGVTMEEPGVSKVLTIDLQNQKKVDEMIV